MSILCKSQFDRQLEEIHITNTIWNIFKKINIIFKVENVKIIHNNTKM